jgi:tetratricopeptide (TPR) repeat protein
MNDDIKERLKRLKEIVSKRTSDEAVTYIDNELGQDTDAQYKSELLLAKALCLSGMISRNEIVKLLLEATEVWPSNVGPHYFLGENFLEEGSFVVAAKHFSRAIELTKSTGNAWFADSAAMLGAYCFARLGKKAKSIELLDSIADDVSVVWLDSLPQIDKETVRRAMP